MSKPDPVLLEIGCEEIPPRMIPRAARDLERCVVDCLDRAGLTHGAATHFGGPRRLAVRVDQVQSRQADRDEVVLGPAVGVAFSDDGAPTRAAMGFAKKHGIDPERLVRMDTPKGVYAGFERKVEGRTVGQVLAEELPAKVESISFPKTMRWGDGQCRWVRPVHWVLALHGKSPLPIELFGIAADRCSIGHRFLGRGEVEIEHPDVYARTLEAAFVVVDSGDRRACIEQALLRAAEETSGVLIRDDALLAEVSDLVEWPGVVRGSFDPEFLALPRELLMTTLRHHQKSFSVESPDGVLMPVFLAVANTDRDPAGHVRRGNEWVVSGRLEDAAFFWAQDRTEPLEARSARLEGVVFHAKLGTFADKARRMESLAGRVSERLSLSEVTRENARRASYLSKNDLVTSTVGEFPELQGQVGGLLLEAEGVAEAVASGVYHHYRPVGSDDEIPPTDVGCLASIADKLDSLSEMVRLGEKPKGSRDPFGLRRAASGVFRIVIERSWPLSLENLVDVVGSGRDDLSGTLEKLLENFLRDQGYTHNEVLAVLRPKVSEREWLGWSLFDVVARLDALHTVRSRSDFEHLVDLTKRVDNILSKDSDVTRSILDRQDEWGDYRETEPAAVELSTMTERHEAALAARSEEKDYAAVVDLLADFVKPVDRFFESVLVLDPENLESTHFRRQQLAGLREVLTRYFDIRELAGQADRRQP